MKKKIYLLVVVAMLVVCMASMIACSNTTDATKKGNTTLDISNGIGSTSQELGMQVNCIRSIFFRVCNCSTISRFDLC